MSTITESRKTSNFASYNEGTRNKNLKFVDNLDDYKVHHDDTDIREFSAKSVAGETFGEVEGLLADVSARRVRYVEIELEDDVISRHSLGRYSEDDRHVLIPIGLVKVNKDDRSVTIHGVELDHMVDYPRYNRDGGYSTRYELDTNNYLAGFHEYGNTYQRDVHDTEFHRSGNVLTDSFYNSRFYTGA